MFNSEKDKSKKMKHVYNESVNMMNFFLFGLNGLSNLTEMVPAFGMDDTVPRPRLHYTKYYLTPGICSLIKTTAIESMMSFRGLINTVMLWYTISMYICHYHAQNCVISLQFWIWFIFGGSHTFQCIQLLRVYLEFATMLYSVTTRSVVIYAIQQ